MPEITTKEAIDTFNAWIQKDTELVSKGLADQTENIAVYKKAIWALELVETIRFMTTPKDAWLHTVEYLNDAPFFITSCPVCKYRVPGESKYCPECGANLRRGVSDG